MNHIKYFFLAVVLLLTASSGATGQPTRLVGANKLVLDNNDLNPANDIYIVDNLGSLGIDNLGIITGLFPNTASLLTLSAGTKTTNLRLDGGSSWGLDVANTNNSIRTSGGSNLGDGLGADNLTVNLGGGTLILNGIPAPAAPSPLTNLLYLGPGNQVTQVPGSVNFLTGSGTLNTIALWTPSGSEVGNSIMTQTGGGTGITITGGSGLTISGATTALQIGTGSTIVGTPVFVASGGAVPAGATVVDVNDNAVVLSVATVTLPAGSAGQIVYITTDDPDGVKITVGLASVTLSNAEVGKFMFIGGIWRIEH
ncbi:MAG: hypothetical protein ABI778_00805 [Ignavibacteriota bacterium]